MGKRLRKLTPAVYFNFGITAIRNEKMMNPALMAADAAFRSPQSVGGLPASLDSAVR
jgi:hypothetical protein